MLKHGGSVSPICEKNNHKNQFHSLYGKASKKYYSNEKKTVTTTSQALPPQVCLGGIFSSTGKTRASSYQLRSG